MQATMHATVSSAAPCLRARPMLAARPARASARRLVCSATQETDDRMTAKLAVPAAAICSALLLCSAMAPEEALAARSGGRVGASGFSSRRASAPRAAPQMSRSSTTYNTYVAPPVVSSYGYGGGFGMPFGGFRIMPTFYMPFPFLGGILQFFFLAMVVGVVFNVVKGVVGSGSSSSSTSKRGKDSNDDWDEL